MKLNLIGKILGVLLILAAFYSPDFNSFNGVSVFIILNLSGLSNLLNDSDSEFCQKLVEVFKRTALVISIVVIIKMILLGY